MLNQEQKDRILNALPTEARNLLHDQHINIILNLQNPIGYVDKALGQHNLPHMYKHMEAYFELKKLLIQEIDTI